VGFRKLNENGVMEVVDTTYIDVSSTTVYAIRILDIAPQSVVNTKDGSGIPDQISLNRGKIIDIGLPNRTIPNDIKLEIQPQIISKIVLLRDDGIFQDTGITGDIEFFISLKMTEKKPSIIEYGYLNNININQ